LANPWATKKGAKNDLSFPIHINVDRLRALCSKIKRDGDQLNAILCELGDHIKIFYEDIATDPHSALKPMFDQLGLKVESSDIDWTGGHEKASPSDISKAVSNFEEIRNDSFFECYL